MIAAGASDDILYNNNEGNRLQSQNTDSNSSSQITIKKNSFDGKYKNWIDPSDAKYVNWVIFLLIINMIWIHITMPIRLSLFEGTINISLTMKIIDIMVDFLNISDMVMHFFIPALDTSGGWNAGYIFERKQVAVEYLKSWFFIDLSTNIPYSFIDMRDYPQVFLTMMSFKIMRIRKAHHGIKKLIRKLGFGVVTVRFTISCWNLLMMLHLTACIWGTAGQVYIVNGDNENWISE